MIFTITVVAPEIGTVNPTSGSTNDKIKINGLFFGTKKREVTIGGKTCRVLSWTIDPMTGEGEIQFVVPRGLSSGIHEIKVINAVGMDTTNFAID